MTYFQKANNFPPILCRLMAQEKCKPLDAVTISARSETSSVTGMCLLSPYQVDLISQETAWHGILTSHMHAFLNGCGTHFDQPKQFRRMADYLRKDPMFNYLRRDPRWKELYLPLLLRWLRAGQTTPPTWPPLRELVQRLSPLLKHH